MHEPNEEAVQNLRDTILKRGWKDSAEFITHELAFVTDLVAAGLLPIAEIRKFTRSMRITSETVRQMRGGSAEDAVYHLLEAGRGFTRALQPGRNSAGPTE